MRKTALRIIKRLDEGPGTLGEISEDLGKSKSWVSNLLSELRDDGVVEKKGKEFKLSETYEAKVFSRLSRSYNPVDVLSGKKEDILREILGKPKTVERLEREGYAKTTLRDNVKDLKEVGAVGESSEGLEIADGVVREVVKARTERGPGEEYRAGEEKIIKAREGKDMKGEKTAFSAFVRYGVDYHTKDEYIYRGGGKPGPEEVLIHAVRFAEDKKQASMVGVFYLKNRDIIDASKVWKLSDRWDCVEKWADFQAFVDRREVRNEELFPKWKEFASLTEEYDVYLRDKHLKESLLKGLEDVGEKLREEVNVFLLGGGNLILRGLKDSTKDLDVVLDERKDCKRLVKVLKEMDYDEKIDLEKIYEEMEPSAILERKGFPRWDIFVRSVVNGLVLTEEMKDRAEEYETFGNLRLQLLSLEDILLFKSITDREGDVEDVALITRKGGLNWNEVMEEIKKQEKLREKYFSFSVLDTFDILKDGYDIEIPIHKDLVSYTLEIAILLTLRREEKTIKEIRKELNFPDHRIYNKLRKLEDEGKIGVDRDGKLNRYSTSEKLKDIEG